MQSVYRVNASELDDRFLESLKALFGDRQIEIVVSSVDETDYLLNNEANRWQSLPERESHLLRAIKNVERRKNLVEVNLEGENFDRVRGIDF